MDAQLHFECHQCHILNEKLGEIEKYHRLKLLGLKKKMITKSSLIKEYKLKCNENDQLKEQCNMLNALVKQLESNCKKCESDLMENLKTTEPLQRETEKLKREWTTVQVAMESMENKLDANQKLIDQLRACIIAKEQTEMKSKSELKHMKEELVSKNSEISRLNRNVCKLSKLRKPTRGAKKKIEECDLDPESDEVIESKEDAEMDKAGELIEGMLTDVDDDDCGRLCERFNSEKRQSSLSEDDGGNECEVHQEVETCLVAEISDTETSDSNESLDMNDDVTIDDSRPADSKVTGVDNKNDIDEENNRIVEQPTIISDQNQPGINAPQSNDDCSSRLEDSPKNKPVENEESVTSTDITPGDIARDERDVSGDKLAPDAKSDTNSEQNFTMRPSTTKSNKSSMFNSLSKNLRASKPINLICAPVWCKNMPVIRRDRKHSKKKRAPKPDVYHILCKMCKVPECINRPISPLNSDENRDVGCFSNKDLFGDDSDDELIFNVDKSESETPAVVSRCQNDALSEMNKLNINMDDLFGNSASDESPEKETSVKIPFDTQNKMSVSNLDFNTRPSNNLEKKCASDVVGSSTTTADISAME